jgi:hypothetical protein
VISGFRSGFADESARTGLLHLVVLSTSGHLIHAGNFYSTLNAVVWQAAQVSVFPHIFCF